MTRMAEDLAGTSVPAVLDNLRVLVRSLGTTLETEALEGYRKGRLSEGEYRERQESVHTTYRLVDGLIGGLKGRLDV